LLRTKVDAQQTLWEAILPPELLRLPPGLEQVDRLLDDPVFFEPFVPFFHPVIGRPSIPMETYLRMMFLRFRYRLGFETLCAEVTDSLAWRRFCRIGITDAVPHSTTLMKITSRCGQQAVDQLNEALLRKAMAAHVVKLDRVRADTTVVPANVAYPTDSGLLSKGVAKLTKTVRASRRSAWPVGHAFGTAPGRCVVGPTRSQPGCAGAVETPKRRCWSSRASWPGSPTPPSKMPISWPQMLGGRCIGPVTRRRERPLPS